MPGRNRLAERTSRTYGSLGQPRRLVAWGDEAFEEARRRDVPVLVSIGYSACHWCHVMAHESFEDPEVGKIVNDRFVAIKVDREERPDVDDVYMEATQAMTGHGGWPMTVFTTPDGRPFFAEDVLPTAEARCSGSSSCANGSAKLCTPGDDLVDQARQLTGALGRSAVLAPADGVPARAEVD